MNDQIEIREMKLEDLDEIMRIERELFSSQWPRSIFRSELTENPYAYYYIMKFNKKIIGYAGIWLMREGAQVTNIAISPKYQGKSLGKKLFSFIFQKAINEGCESLSLEVRKSNEIAQNMYRQFGLVPAGIRKEYYTDNREDAIIMWVNFK